MTVELYFFQPLGSNSGRVFLTLLEKGVAFIERELIGPDFEHLGPEYLAINPKGQVPTLVHDGDPLTEGTAVCEYIDEAFEGPPLRPANLRARWGMRRWCRYIDNEIGRCVMMIHWNRIVPVFVGARTAAEVEQIIARVPNADRRMAWRNAYLQKTPPQEITESRRRLAVAARRIEAALTGGAWLCGSDFSLADIDLLNFYGFFPSWFPELVNDSAAPNTLAWLDRMEARAAVREMRARTRRKPIEPPR